MPITLNKLLIKKNGVRDIKIYDGNKPVLLEIILGEEFLLNGYSWTMNISQDGVISLKGERATEILVYYFELKSGKNWYADGEEVIWTQIEGGEKYSKDILVKQEGDLFYLVDGEVKFMSWEKGDWEKVDSGSSNTNLIIASVVVAVGVGGYFLYKYFKK